MGFHLAVQPWRVGFDLTWSAALSSRCQWKNAPNSDPLFGPDRPPAQVLPVHRDGRMDPVADAGSGRRTGIPACATPDRSTSNTARTAGRPTLISLIRECQGSTGTGVNHQAEPRKHRTEPKREASSEQYDALVGRGGGSNPRPMDYEDLRFKRHAVMPGPRACRQRYAPNTFLFASSLNDHGWTSRPGMQVACPAVEDSAYARTFR